jgi:molybdate transport system substrate-binding protein
MTRPLSHVFRSLALLAVAALPLVAGAAELKVLSAGAFKPVLLAMQPEFERATGHRLTIDNDTAGGLQRRVGSGEAFDVVVSSPASLQSALQAGRIALAPVPLARVGIGVAVAPGHAKPDIGSVDAFKSMLLSARSVAYIDPAAGGSSGVYLDKLFDQLGVGAPVRAKAVLVPGGLVAERVVNGQAEVAVHQISEILAVKGAVLVGPLPAPIQNYTVYAGAISSASADPGAARQLLDALRGDAVTRLLAERGMERAP